VTLDAPIGLALDGAGDLYVANSGGSQVVDVKLNVGGQLASGGRATSLATPVAMPVATPGSTSFSEPR